RVRPSTTITVWLAITTPSRNRASTSSRPNAAPVARPGSDLYPATHLEPGGAEKNRHLRYRTDQCRHVATALSGHGTPIAKRDTSRPAVSVRAKATRITGRREMRQLGRQDRSSHRTGSKTDLYGWLVMMTLCAALPAQAA